MTVAVKITVTILGAYQRLFRGIFQGGMPLLVPSGCRQWPTCSDYTIEAVRATGVTRGLWAGIKRVARCNAFTHPN